MFIFIVDSFSWKNVQKEWNPDLQPWQEPVFKFSAVDCSSALYLGGFVVLNGLEGGVKILTSFISGAQLTDKFQLLK